MGVYFYMNCARPIEGEKCALLSEDGPELKEGEKFIYVSPGAYNYYGPLFQAGGWSLPDGCHTKAKHVNIRSLVESEGYRVSFAFWDQIAQRYNEIEQAKHSEIIDGQRTIVIPRQFCHAPMDVLETLEAVSSTLQKHMNALPKCFFFRIREDPNTWPCNEAVIQTPVTALLTSAADVLEPCTVYSLEGCWDHCIATTFSGSRIDIRGIKAIKCVVMTWGREMYHGVMQKYKGNELVTVEITPQTLYDHFAPDLAEMKQVCQTALRHNWLIFAFEG